MQGSSTMKAMMLVLSEGPVIDTKKCILGGGCKSQQLQGLPSEAYGPGNRLKVDSYNRLCEYSNIFAIGDTALMSSDAYPKGHPQVVQPAIQQARNLIVNLQRMEQGLPLQPFLYIAIKALWLLSGATMPL